MGVIEERIKSKLLIYSLGTFSELDNKTLIRLKEIEEELIRLEDKSEESFKELKDMSPNITMIIKSDKISFSRKTVYNDEMLKSYLENSIKDFPDYLNEKKLEKVQEDFDMLKELYNKIADKIIDSYDKKEELDLLNEEILNLIKQNDTLRDIVKERDDEIKKLKQKKKTIKINS